ncbi:MAG: CPBP family intramembrane metalloprotease [Blautia sp.]|nr:CPBP family intramembrane metalloprotease [Lachnoclostridium sp.]MCM1211329.1 CPBP family intramembrane metalloprotease [Blautia sp.]
MNQLEEKTENNVATGEKKPVKRKLFDNIFVLYLLVLVLMMLGQILGTFIQFIPFMVSTDISITITMYLTFIGSWILMVCYMRFTKKNRPILQILGKKETGNTWGKFLLGIGIGFGLNGICILVAWLHKDITLYYDTFQPGYLLIIFVAVFIQSSAEELICRGFLYQRLIKSYQKPVVAIVGNALLFALMHLLNDGVTVLSIFNIFTVGILFSLMVYYMDSIWCAMAAHAAWNFMQNILFGLPNSGTVAPYSVFRLDASTANNSFAYNVGFGIEGTLLADVVLILACIGIFLWGRKYGKKPCDIWG